MTVDTVKHVLLKSSINNSIPLAVTYVLTYVNLNDIFTRLCEQTLFHQIGIAYVSGIHYINICTCVYTVLVYLC